MSDQRVTVREIDWQELFPWVILARTLRLAFHGRVLLLATAGLIAAVAGFRLIGDTFFDDTPSKQVQGWRGVDSPWPWAASKAVSEVDGETDGPTARTARHWLTGNGVIDDWQQLTRPVKRLYAKELTGSGFLYTCLCGLWAIVVWSIFGGAITRIAALDLTHGEKLGIRAAVAQTTERIGSYIAAPLLPIIGATIVAIPLIILGFLMRAGFLAWMAGLGWFVVLILGLLIAILLIGFLIGWPLMWATLSVERTDAFDALSRCYSYVYERPFRLFFSILVAAALGFAGVAVVTVFASTTVSLSEWAVSWGSGNERLAKLDALGENRLFVATGALTDSDKASPSASRQEPEVAAPWFERKAAVAIRFWKNMLAAVVAAFPIGFLWTSSVAIYLLQRREIDATEMDEIALETQEEPHSLPPLVDHPSGVPSVEGTEPSDQ